jgi:hypothetical protein
MMNGSFAGRILIAAGISVVMATNIGCGGGGGGGTGGHGGSGGSAGGTGNTSGALVFKPCTPEMRVGGFSILLVDKQESNPEYATFAGQVRDGVDPFTYLRTDTTNGSCRLTAKPTCSTACSPPQVCGVGDACAPEPTSVSVGAVDVTGLTIPITGLDLRNGLYNKDLSSGTYPPLSAGTPLTLSATGGAYSPLMLTISGIEPLEFAGTGITVNRGQALAFTWTAPAKVTGKIQATLNIAYHGGGRYQIDCDFDDDGSGEIPAALIDKLLDQGTAGFPTLALTRRSVDSTTVASLGCVEFEVNAFRQREVTVCPMPNKCIITCGADKPPCPTGQACGNDKKCS